MSADDLRPAPGEMFSVPNPWEEEWEVFKSDAGGWVASHRGDGPIIATIMAPNTRFLKARTALVASAPDMARALLGIISCAHADGETICARCLKDARAALTKAGVTFP